jgi:hypothetical protein
VVVDEAATTDRLTFRNCRFDGVESAWQGLEGCCRDGLGRSTADGDRPAFEDWERGDLVLQAAADGSERLFLRGETSWHAID